MVRFIQQKQPGVKQEKLKEKKSKKGPLKIDKTQLLKSVSHFKSYVPRKAEAGQPYIQSHPYDTVRAYFKTK